MPLKDTMGDLAGMFDVLRIECPTEGRHGRYHVMRLVASSGRPYLRVLHRDAPNAKRPKAVILNRVARLPALVVSTFAVVNPKTASSARTLGGEP